MEETEVKSRFNLSSTTMIHAAVEALAIAGITTWLNTKINTLSTKVTLLEEENKKLSSRLQNIESIIYGGIPPPKKEVHNPAPKNTPRSKEEKSIKKSTRGGSKKEDDEPIADDFTEATGLEEEPELED